MGKTLIFCDSEDIARLIAKTMGDNREIQNGYIGKAKAVYFWTQMPLVHSQRPEDINTKWGSPWRFEVLPFFPKILAHKPFANREADFAAVNDFLSHEDIEQTIVAVMPGQASVHFDHVLRPLVAKNPAYRLWLPSLAPLELQESLGQVAPYKNYIPSLARRITFEEVDWIIGSNFTRATTLAGMRFCLFDRMATPALMLCYEHELSKQSPPCKLRVSFFHQGKFFTGLAVNKRGTVITYANKQKAMEARRRCSIKPGKVIEVKKKKQKINPPQLFNLAQLQIEAGKKYGYPAIQTKDTAINLYLKGAITWPETSCRFLRNETREKFKDILTSIHALNTEKVDTLLARLEADQIKPTCLAEISFDEHEAIRPTAKVVEIDSLSEHEQIVYQLVIDSFIQSLQPRSEEELTRSIIEIGQGRFAVEKVELKIPGWKGAENACKPGCVPDLKKGEQISAVEVKPLFENQGLSESYVLEWMEACGFGDAYSQTHALEKLKKARLLWSDHGKIELTDEGYSVGQTLTKLAEQVPGLTKFLSMKKAAKWHTSIIKEAPKNIDGFHRAYKLAVVEEIKDVCADLWEIVRIHAPCPVCDKTVLKRQSGFACENWLNKDNPCSFFIDDRLFNKQIPPKVITELIENGISDTKMDFISKAGKPYSAQIQLNQENWKVSLYFPPKQSPGICPLCNGTIAEGQKAFFCVNWKEHGCEFKIFKGLDGPDVEAVKELLVNGETTKAFLYEHEGRKRYYKLKLEAGKMRKIRV